MKKGDSVFVEPKNYLGVTEQFGSVCAPAKPVEQEKLLEAVRNHSIPPLSSPVAPPYFN